MWKPWEIRGNFVKKFHLGPFLRPDAHQRYFSRNESFRVQLPSEAVLPPSSCARTHAFHGKIQLYCTAVQDSCIVPRHQYECDVMKHVITGAGRQNDKKNLRRKEEGWPRTGTFFAPWGCMPVMDGPIFNRLQLGMKFYDEIPLYFPRLSCMYVHM